MRDNPDFRHLYCFNSFFNFEDSELFVRLDATVQINL